MKRIDTHGHIYHKEYIEEIGKLGFTHATIPEWVNAEARIADMDKLDIERQVLSQSNPFCYFEDDVFNRYWAQVHNDLIAETCQKYPNRFLGFITVPLRNVNHAIDELKRATKSSGMVGVILGSNLMSKPLDSPELMPFYEEVDNMGLAILIHPMMPVGIEKIQEYQRLHIFIGFLFETTMAVARMASRGIFEKCQNITFILSHYGGALPFVYPSVDLNWERVINERIETGPPKPPSEYFKRFYCDTARPLKRTTLQCAIALFGEDHILFGTDIPYWMNYDTPRRIISAIEAIDLPVQIEENIFYGNAARLFNL